MVYPVVEVEVFEIRCRALLDMRAGSSCTSAALVSKLDRNPDRRECKRIEMMITWTSQTIEMYKLQVFNIRGVLSLPTILGKVEKETWLTIPNEVWI